MNTIKINNTSAAATSSSHYVGTETTLMNMWQTPELVETIELQDSIELVYKQHSLMSNNWDSFPPRVYKIVFSCIDGKWNKSEPIIGEICPAIDESYQF